MHGTCFCFSGLRTCIAMQVRRAHTASNQYAHELIYTTKHRLSKYRLSFFLQYGYLLSAAIQCTGSMLEKRGQDLPQSLAGHLPVPHPHATGVTALSDHRTRPSRCEPCLRGCRQRRLHRYICRSRVDELMHFIAVESCSGI